MKMQKLLLQFIQRSRHHNDTNRKLQLKRLEQMGKIKTYTLIETGIEETEESKFVRKEK